MSARAMIHSWLVRLHLATAERPLTPSAPYALPKPGTRVVDGDGNGIISGYVLHRGHLYARVVYTDDRRLHVAIRSPYRLAAA